MDQIQIPCFKNTKVCIKNNKCSICFLDVSPNKCVELYEMENLKFKIKIIKDQLPKQCKNCNFLQILNVDKQIVYCPYMIKDRCIIK